MLQEDRSSLSYPPGHGPPFPRYFPDPAAGFSEELIHIAEQDAQEPVPMPMTNFVFTDSEQMATYVELGVEEFPTKTTERIFGNFGAPSLLQEWVTLFMEKQADYGDRADDLGIPGQYAELNRKMLKLRRAMWEGKELVGEQPKEIIQDLIGHCFLALKLMEDNNWGGKDV